MTRTVNGERLFGDREKEVLRKMLWQVADYSGVEVLTYALMGNHFHVLIRVPEPTDISDEELMRRWRVLYPKPTKYEAAKAEVLEEMLAEARATGSGPMGSSVSGASASTETEELREKAEAFRRRHLARMHDLSEFMRTLKQRFTIWFNQTHGRYGPLWSDRFKSVLVEGKGNPLQTMAAYIDLNPVRAGLVADPKDYRFCGYGQAVAGDRRAREGLGVVWASHADGSARGELAAKEALEAHRSYLFTKGSEKDGGIDHAAALKVLKAKGTLPKGAALRCRVRYFTDGAILGSAEFVRGHADAWQRERNRKHRPKAHPMEGADWGDLRVIQGLRRQVFG
ncbi:MAG: transposase [Verrucomicrobiota bacterium]